jgi:magnesium chelatase subunit D
MGLALVLTTISPEIGGVLVRGEKGTAKSTTVRALAAVLPPIDVYAADRFSVDPHDPATRSPDGPFPPEVSIEQRAVRLVELPVGATEDRVLGSLHLEHALSQGRVEYEPGLLARAHRGILYVDEVNLLHDHLVDLLLDAAAMGRATVERDGVSMEHPARFVLIGTMNPEEGELRPQLLDRFGLTVEVAAPRDPGLRAEVVRRRMAHDADPDAFATRFHDDEAALTSRIDAARERVGKVLLSEAALLKIAEVCAAFEVDGLRADIVTARAALAHAAWEGRDEVTRADIRRAAVLSLPHRRRRKPFDAPGLDEELLDQLLGDDEPEPDPPEGPGPDDDQGPPPTPDDGTSDPASDPDVEAPSREKTRTNQATRPPEDVVPPRFPQPPDASDLSTVGSATPYRPRLLTVRGLGEGGPGRRSRAIASDGRRVGAQRPTGTVSSLHLVETLRAAAGRVPSRRPGGGVILRPEDLRTAVREGREANLVLFCVDASGSMAARRRMTQVKTAILSLLLDAYRRRDKVGLITFRGDRADLVLPPTRSVEIAARRLEELPAGGRTPLAEGLLEAAAVLTRERIRDPRLRPLLVVVTDGRATGGDDPVGRSHQAADAVVALGVSTVVVDGESGPLRLGLARSLAYRMGAEHVPVAEVSAESLGTVARERGRGVA